MRSVFDTNVLISALVSPGSTARAAFDRARRDGVVILSPAVATELREVLTRRKLRRYVSEEDARLLLAILMRHSTWVVQPIEVAECRDPRDDKFLGLAVSGRATHIVTGDDDLLVLDPFRGIRIVTPRQFLDL